MMKVHMIETGTVRIKTAQVEARRAPPWAIVDVLTSREWTEWVPTYAFAIETDHEGVIVIDGGQATHLLEEVKRSPHPFHRLAARFRITPEQEIGPQLRALGMGPRDVTTVVLTHMHIDHDAGIAHFPNSQILAVRAARAGAERWYVRAVRGKQTTDTRWAGDRGGDAGAYAGPSIGDRRGRRRDILSRG
jgi:N-acyl homoserine lactone hydrolase